MAMMCRTRLMRRLPARERRWRFWSPEEASIGAVPFHEAKCPAVRNRLMSPMSPNSRAAPDGPIPLSSRSELPVAATSWRSCLSAARILASMTVSSSMSSRASWWRVCADDADRLRRGPQKVAGLAAGQELLGSAGDQLEQQHVDAADDLGAGPAQFVAAVDQQPQRDGDIVGRDLA